MAPSNSTFLAVACVGLLLGPQPGRGHDFRASVVQVRVVAADTSVRFGSGVIVDRERIATACHLTRDAASIEIVHRGQRWKSESQLGSPAHDLCVLIVPSADAPVARLRPSHTLRPSEPVVAAGFQHGAVSLVEKHGIVAALYPYDDGNVIRTSAAFDFGASGGGLFDEAGHLVGLLAFKGRTGNSARFALPSEWIADSGRVAAGFMRIDAGLVAPAFWERPEGKRPAFLGVAMREVAGKHD